MKLQSLQGAKVILFRGEEIGKHLKLPYFSLLVYLQLSALECLK